MAASWFGEGESIQGKWGRPPELSAPNIAGLVSAILEDRRKREALTGAGIAETIKNVRGERQSNELLDAMRAQGLVPQDYEAGGVGGAAYGLKLADQLREKKEAEARARYTDALKDAVGGGGGGNGTGDNIMDVDETQYPLYKTDANNNIIAYRHIQRGPHGQLIINYTPVNVPLQPTTTRQPSVKDTYQLEAEKQKEIENLQPWREIQRQQDADAGRANVPFKRQAEEDKLRQEIEELRRQRTTPSADSGAGHTEDYGVKVKPGDKVTLKDGRKVTVTAVNPDGTVEYQ